MEQKKQPVQQYYYSNREWDRLGCGPLPAERDQAQVNQNIMDRANPRSDGKVIKGSN